MRLVLRQDTNAPHTRIEAIRQSEIDNAKFAGKSIAEETTIERIFLEAQEVIMNLDKFDEMIDAPHAYAERDAKRLSELESKRRGKRSSGSGTKRETYEEGPTTSR